jgi:hypothetical protein
MDLDTLRGDRFRAPSSPARTRATPPPPARRCCGTRASRRAGRWPSSAPPRRGRRAGGGPLRAGPWAGGLGARRGAPLVGHRAAGGDSPRPLGAEACGVDAGARLAEAGRRGGRDLARALAAHGLAFPVGHCSTVPLGGYLLGGGFGWNAGAWGVACHAVEGVEVVTADGGIRRASGAEEPDIFWAARGAGPAFFGVVTRYRLRLRPLPRAITTAPGPTASTTSPGRGLDLGGAARPAAPRRGGPGVGERAAASGRGLAQGGDGDRHRLRRHRGGGARHPARLGAGAPEGALAAEPPPPPPPSRRCSTGWAGCSPKAAATPPTTPGPPPRCAPSWRRWRSGSAGPPRPRPSPSCRSCRPPRRRAAATPAGAALSMAGPGLRALLRHLAGPVGRRGQSALAAGDRRGARAAGGRALRRRGRPREPGRLRRCFSPAAWDRLSAVRAEYDPAGMFRKAL